MTLHIERARSRRPVTWLTLIGVLLLPVVVGGILVASLYNPVERLDSLTAAIVNEDEPVTIDDQLVPLGRQLTAGLVEGSDDLDSNLTWTISNPDDAEEGLADGTYAAVIVIPDNFSAAATSTQPGETPQQAVIEVQTPPDSLIVDDAITAQVATAAASLMGQQLSELYLENVLLGFTTIGDELGGAADGAQQLADGAQQAADGAAELPGGIGQLADGTAQLGTGAGALAGGAGQLANGTAQLGDGAGQLAGGAGQLAGGATALQGGLTSIAGAIRDAATGAQQLAAGIDVGAAQIEQDGLVPAQVTDLAAQSASTAGLSAQASAGVLAIAQGCADSGASAEYCETLLSAATGAEAAAQGTAQLAGGTQLAVDGLAAQLPVEIAAQFRTISANVAALASGLVQIAGAVDQSAAGAGEIAGGASGLQSGASALESGAGELAGGAIGIQSGASALASGAAQLSDGATQAATGAQSLADGVQTLADGTGELATGLDTAVEAIPAYSDEEAESVATVVSNPVAAEGVGTSLFGASAIPLLATLALWFGGLGTFVALQAVSRRTLTSRAPSAVLALRQFLPAAALGAVQGLLVAGVVQLAASYSWAEWSVFAGISIAAGVAFAAVNQGLVAVFGGAGRWISALIGVLAVATGVVSTVPGVLSDVAALMPTAPAYNGMLAALTSASGTGAALAGLAVWTFLGLVSTILVVARRRTLTTRALLAA